MTAGAGLFRRALAASKLGATVGGLLLVLGSPTSGRAAEDHSGTYVFFQQTTIVTELPVISDIVATTRAVSVQQLTHDGKRLHGSGNLCDLHLESSSSMIATELPVAFRLSMPPVRTDAVLEEKGTSTLFYQAPQTLIIGARLKDAKKEAMPVTPDDPRVYDQDKDGKPGITVKVSGFVTGEVYLAQRGTSSLRGALKGNAFTGSVKFENEQHILDASSFVLKGGPGGRFDPNRSYFRLQKVAPGFTCEQAKQLSRTWR